MPNIKCKICGTEFPALAKDHYIVRDLEKTGLAAAFGSEESGQFDAFDCPNCGCQVIAQQRKPLCLFEEIMEDNEEEVAEAKEDDEEEQEDWEHYSKPLPTNDLNDKSVDDNDILVVIKSADHVFVKETVKSNLKSIVIDLNELLHANNWSGVLHGDDSYIAF